MAELPRLPYMPKMPEAGPTLILNAGGASRRMGRSKALLPVPPGGVPLLQHMVNRLACLGLRRVVVVTNDPAVAALELSAPAIAVDDRWPAAGALGGLATGLELCEGWALALACDLPMVSPAVCRLIWQTALAAGDRADAVAPVVDSHAQVFYAAYHPRCLPAMRADLEAGRLRANGFLARVRTRYLAQAEIEPVDPGAASFMNANTPEEWEAALRLLAAEQPPQQP